MAGNTQRDKMSRGEWEKADDEIQAGWEYADRGTKVGMLSGRSQMQEYKQMSGMHTAGQKQKSRRVGEF